ncbi:MAG: dTDP-4-dehydrorhamnose 3,5-epimerase family protein, partial [Candidatus Woesebacteria bacterium]|nr:dTDP-4-dehydrorhamnose 3,5-epimerase family protein [Candidatus Woesebacteria bacterium]
ITSGIANSFCNFGKENAHYLYLVDNYYDGSDKKAVAWDDPDLNIKWPIKAPILSDRDKNNPRLRDVFPDKFTGR